jgi:hypothetical protein
MSWSLIDAKNDIKLSKNDGSESEEETKDYFSSFYSLRKCLESLYLSSNKSVQFDNRSNLLIKIGQKNIESIYEKEIKNIRPFDFEVNAHKVKMYVGEKKSSESFKDTCTYIYYKNRLIETVDKKKTKGKCSDKNISILQANFLTPKHNKREFEKNEEYKKLRRQINEKNNKYMENYKDSLKNKSAKVKPQRNQDDNNSRSNSIENDLHDNDDIQIQDINQPQNILPLNTDTNEIRSNSVENDVNYNHDIQIQDIDQPQNIPQINIDINEGDSNSGAIVHDGENFRHDEDIQLSRVQIENASRTDTVINERHSVSIEIIHNDEDIQIVSSKQAEELVDVLKSKRSSARLKKKVKNFTAQNESGQENFNIPKKSNSRAKRKPSPNLEQLDETILPSTSKLLKKNALIDELNTLREVCIKIHTEIEQDERFFSQFEKCKALAEKFDEA